MVSGKHIRFSNATDLSIIGAALLFLIVIAAVAALYPAVILSSYRPVKALKGKLTTNQSGVHSKTSTSSRYTTK